MKTNLKLNSTLSLKALEAKGRRAAAIASNKASSSRKTQNDVALSPKTHRKQTPLIEREINSIYRILKSKMPVNQTLVLERPGKNSTCRATLKIYSNADLLRQKEEEKTYQKLIAEGTDRRMIEKPFKATPIVMYAFYTSILDPHKLGSIAIYGGKPKRGCSLSPKLN